MDIIKTYSEFLNEDDIHFTTDNMSCPSCGVDLDINYYQTIGPPRKCVGCGEDVEEVLNRKDWDWS